MIIGHHNLPQFRKIFSVVLLRILVFTALSLGTKPVFAFEAAGGFSVVEQGDDLTRPAASLHMAANDFYAGRIYLWGRSYGPVEEQTLLVSAFRRFGLFSSNAITGSIGIALLDEYTAIDYKDDSVDSSFNGKEHNYNLGAQFGLSASLVNAGPLYLSMNWDSHVFLAGAGGILLASGRKQTLGVLMGVSF